MLLVISVLFFLGGELAASLFEGFELFKKKVLFVAIAMAAARSHDGFITVIHFT